MSLHCLKVCKLITKFDALLFDMSIPLRLGPLFLAKIGTEDCWFILPFNLLPALLNIWKVAENKFITLYLHPSSGCIPVGTFFSQNIVHSIYKLRLVDLILITMNVQRWPQNCVTVKQSGDLYRWSMQCTQQLHTTRIFYYYFMHTSFVYFDATVIL